MTNHHWWLQRVFLAVPQLRVAVALSAIFSLNATERPPWLCTVLALSLVCHLHGILIIRLLIFSSSSGPVVGPVAGGFIAQTIGVEFIFIVIASSFVLIIVRRSRTHVCLGFCGLAGLIGIPLLRETYAPIIRLRRAQRLGDPEKVAQLYPTLAHADNGKLHFLWINLSRPMILLSRSFICFILSLYMAL